MTTKTAPVEIEAIGDIHIAAIELHGLLAALDYLANVTPYAEPQIENMRLAITSASKRVAAGIMSDITHVSDGVHSNG